MRADFYRPEERDRVVAIARWEGGRVVIEADGALDREALARVFRPSPIVVDDPAFRSLGAHGEAVVQPGSLDWFRVAALVRSETEGLTARLVPEIEGEGGWDPAAAYRTFREEMTRLVNRPAAPASRSKEPEE